MGILAARVAGQQAPRVLEAGGVVALDVVVVGQPRQQAQVVGAQALAIDSGLEIRAAPQIATVDIRGALVGIRGSGKVARA